MNIRLATIGDYLEPVATWNPASKPHDMFVYVDLGAVSQAEKRIIAGASVLGSEAPSRARQLIKNGDVLVSTVRPNLNGVAPVTNEFDKATASTGFCVLRPRTKKLASNYLMHWVRSPQFIDSMVRQATGASYPAVTDRIVKSALIPLPPLDEQQRIAATLDRADALRRKRKRAIELLDGLTQSIFVEMFGDPISNPSGWSVDRLGNVCDVRDGTHDSPKYVDEGFPLLTSKNFSGGAIDFNGAKLISTKDYEEINIRSKVDIGDIVMPMIGTIGSPVLIADEPNFAIKNVALFKFKSESPPAEFVISLLDGPLLQAKISNVGRGGTQKFLSLSDLRELKIPVPPKSMQEKFKLIFRSHSRAGKYYSAAVSSMGALFSSLQHRAFSGQL